MKQWLLSVWSKMRPNLWLYVLGCYIIWNVCAYSSKMLFGIRREWYDYMYWINERIFVLLALLVVLTYAPRKYKWVIRAMIFVAIFKLAYIILVVTKTIKANDWASLMGVLFMVVLGVVTIRWEKQKK